MEDKIIFKKGELVVLRCSPEIKMLVHSVRNIDLNIDLYECLWMDKLGRLQVNHFNSIFLDFAESSDEE